MDYSPDVAAAHWVMRQLFDSYPLGLHSGAIIENAPTEVIPHLRTALALVIDAGWAVASGPFVTAVVSRECFTSAALAALETAVDVADVTPEAYGDARSAVATVGAVLRG